MGGLTGLEIIYVVCALLGGIPLVIRLILQFLGAADMDGDMGLDDADADFGDIDADASLKFLSLHGITSFLMMFGLVGFALIHQSRVGALWSLVGAGLAGLASFWIIGKVFQLIYSMQSFGTMRLSDAIGAQGKVYLTIREGGVGRVMVTVSGQMRELDAAAGDGQEIKTDQRIEVVDIKGNMLIVKQI